MKHFKHDDLRDAATPLSSDRAAMTGNPLSCISYERESEILALEDEWRCLETVSPDTVLFQSFDWCRNHLEFSKHGNHFRPLVFVVRLGEKPLLLLPLCLQRKNGMNVLTGFSEPFQQYTELLCDRVFLEQVGREAIRDCLLDAMGDVDADYLHLGQVREDGMLARLLKGRAEPSGEADAAPYVQLSEHADHDAYLKTIKSKTRKNLRNARNRLERDAPVTHLVARSGPKLAEVISRTHEGREAWLEEMGITSRAFQDVDFEAFVNRFGMPDAHTGVETVAMSLMHGDVAVSDQWGFVYRGRYYAFMATWNPDYEAVSPGRLHLGEVIHSCFDEGLEAVDFMIPAVPYKLTWTDHMTPVRDIILPLGMKGAVFKWLWLDFARPLAKRIFFALPAGLRGRLLHTVTGS